MTLAVFLVAAEFACLKAIALFRSGELCKYCIVCSMYYTHVCILCAYFYERGKGEEEKGRKDGA